MMLVLDNIDDIPFISEKLTQLDYDSIRRQNSTIRFHLHLHERGSPQIKRHVNQLSLADLEHKNHLKNQRKKENYARHYALIYEQPELMPT